LEKVVFGYKYDLPIVLSPQLSSVVFSTKYNKETIVHKLLKEVVLCGSDSNEVIVFGLCFSIDNEITFNPVKIYKHQGITCCFSNFICIDKINSKKN
jgi:hypothetical protein